MEGVTASGRIKPATCHQPGGTGLLIPAPELRQVNAGRVLHGTYEFIRGDSLPVVPIEVQVATFAESLCTKQAVQHAYDLSALNIDGQGVEIVDLDIGIRLDWMGHRARVLAELLGAEQVRVLNSLDPAGPLNGTELLITKDSEGLFEAELEPVPQRNPIARPVVEVLVADDAGHGLVVAVGGGSGQGQYVLSVEYIEALVFHSPHVEILDCDDVVPVEVILAAIGLFIPAHGFTQSGQRVATLGQITVMGVDPQRHCTARVGDKAVFEVPELACDQGKEITGFGVGVVPGSLVAATVYLVTLYQITVGQQHRVAAPVSLQGNPVGR